MLVLKTSTGHRPDKQARICMIVRRFLLTTLHNPSPLLFSRFRNVCTFALATRTRFAGLGTYAYPTHRPRMQGWQAPTGIGTRSGFPHRTGHTGPATGQGGSFTGSHPIPAGKAVMPVLFYGSPGHTRPATGPEGLAPDRPPGGESHRSQGAESG